jgi:hypothetical protein
MMTLSPVQQRKLLLVAVILLVIGELILGLFVLSVVKNNLDNLMSNLSILGGYIIQIVFLRMGVQEIEDHMRVREIERRLGIRKD